MVARHPYRSVGAVLAVLAVCLFVSGRIGQFHEGPWGGLPTWVGAATWFGFLGSALTVVLLSAYLAVARVRHRKALA